MKWITRERPKIDRIACPWLIKRFIDVEAEFFFVSFQDVMSKANELDAIPFDVPNVEHTHYNDECTLDYLVKKYKIDDPAISLLALIVRGADTDRYDLAPQSAGLAAISIGLAHKFTDDYKLLEQGMLLYDALYSWAKYYPDLKHSQNQNEHLLLTFFRLINREVKVKRKPPNWVRELKIMIQDLIDTNLSFSLKDISNKLDVNPSYVSREFSKYFDEMSFGEYIQNQRIEKAIHLIETTKYSLGEIAFLTGFSDICHFSRTFKKITKMNPSEMRKKSHKYSNSK